MKLSIFMRKKPEYRAACGGDEWPTGVWGRSPHIAFSVKRYPAACGGVLHSGLSVIAFT
jgi:hypothetical protein